MSESLPAESTPVRKTADTGGGELILLGVVAALGIIAGLIVVALGLNIEGDFLDGFDVEDLAQKIAVTVVGVGLGVVGFVALIAAVATSSIRDALRNGE